MNRRKNKGRREVMAERPIRMELWFGKITNVVYDPHSSSKCLQYSAGKAPHSQVGAVAI